MSASLSVVVVSAGTTSDTIRATQSIGASSIEIGAQVIVVSCENNSDVAKLAESHGIEFIVAPPGSSRSELCDLGMRRTLGSIVLVRDDTTITDGRMLDPYRSLPHQEKSHVAAQETVVMDSRVASREGLADAPAPLPLVAGTELAPVKLSAAI